MRMHLCRVQLADGVHGGSGEDDRARAGLGRGGELGVGRLREEGMEEVGGRRRLVLLKLVHLGGGGALTERGAGVRCEPRHVEIGGALGDEEHVRDGAVGRMRQAAQLRLRREERVPPLRFRRDHNELVGREGRLQEQRVVLAPLERPARQDVRAIAAALFVADEDGLGSGPAVRSLEKRLDVPLVTAAEVERLEKRRRRGLRHPEHAWRDGRRLI